MLVLIALLTVCACTFGNLGASRWCSSKAIAVSFVQAISSMNLTFTIMFTVELAVNMTATLCVEFFRDAWNWFDTVVVLVSLISVFLDNMPGVSVSRPSPMIAASFFYRRRAHWLRRC